MADFFGDKGCGPTHHQGCECHEARRNAEIAALKAALKAAQAVFNQIQCYSTGVSVMAEEDMVEIFGKYSDLADGLLE